MDISDIVTLDTNEEVIQFNVEGYYKIAITILAYVKQENTDFDSTKDFVSFGFRLVDTENLFIGASEWIYYEEPKQIVAQGIIAVEDISNAYELVNLSPQTIYLHGPSLGDIGATSYFANSLITIVIEYLGRQGA